MATWWKLTLAPAQEILNKISLAQTGKKSIFNGIKKNARSLGTFSCYTTVGNNYFIKTSIEIGRKTAVISFQTETACFVEAARIADQIRKACYANKLELTRHER